MLLLLVLVEPSTIEGDWRNPNGSVIITIGPCGDALCGRVRWASEEAMADARRGGTDPLIGAEILSDLVPFTSNRFRGRIFVPDANRRSGAQLELLGPDQVRIKGCAVGGRLFCRSQVWNRVITGAS
jgi:uncharacterized protein (DUF2147 family)